MGWTKIGVVFDHTLKAFYAVAAVILVFGMLSVCFDVIMRYTLRLPQLWVYDIVPVSLVFITFLAATWVLRKDRHVRMDLLTIRLSPRSRALLDSLTSILCAVMWFIITWASIFVTWEAVERQEKLSHSAMELPKWLIGIVAVGSVLLGIQLLRMAAVNLASLRGHITTKERYLEDISWR